jgi:hypothetical protein
MKNLLFFIPLFFLPILIFGMERGLEIAEKAISWNTIGVTDHGLQKLIERGFSPEKTREFFENPDFIMTQSDGAKVFIKKTDTKYDIVIYNVQTHEIVTALHGIHIKKMQNLSKNYGWKLSLNLIAET